MFSAVFTHASSHTNVAPRALTRTCVAGLLYLPVRPPSEFCSASSVCTNKAGPNVSVTPIDPSETSRVFTHDLECQRFFVFRPGSSRSLGDDRYFRNPTCKERCLIIPARERPRAGSKQMATYQAVAQTQSSSSSSNLCCSAATQTWSAHVARLLQHTTAAAAVWRIIDLENILEPNFPKFYVPNLEVDKHLKVDLFPFSNFGKFGKFESLDSLENMLLLLQPL